MAFNDEPGQSSRSFRPDAFQGTPGLIGDTARRSDEPQFDILEWYPQFQSCHRYFLDHAQHSGPVQAVAAFINITLPCHKTSNPVLSSTASSPQSAGPSIGIIPPLRQSAALSLSSNFGNAQAVSLTPYIRRLIVTGFDNPAVLHGFFGDDWLQGIGRLHEVERRNYLFAAKSSSWLEVKADYDMSPNETIPFLKPLQAATEKEILAAEASWSDWLAMQDWMVGPRAPDEMDSSTRFQSPNIKREPQD